MEKLGLNEIRERYLSFFESKGHLRLPSFPLVPQNDDSLLLINAGMAPLKPYFLGKEIPPRKRVTTCQKCIRTPDIERVGKTARHGTFFEMLGNFSFGDYFKHEATAWAWEFITEDLKLPEDKLWVTVYEDDDEAIDIWTKEVGVKPERIKRMGKEDNFWEIGTGPCGPCSEIYFDRGEEHGCGKPDCSVGCDCDRYVEFWNLVFTQFDKDENGNYNRLAKPNIDTGMGLERIAAIMQGVENLFEVDTVRNIMLEISKIAGIHYGDDEKTDVSLRVITDHIRSTTFLVCDGVGPSNEGRGYVLRRLLRRAARHGKLLGIEGTFLWKVADTAINESKNAYPQLEQKREYIKKVIRIEEERFALTLDSGLSILEGYIAELEKNGKTTLSGEDAFRLYDTYGFPLDLTNDILEEKGLEVDTIGFEKAMEEQKTRARERRNVGDEVAWSEDVYMKIGKDVTTQFDGYENESVMGHITAIVKDNEIVQSVSDGENAVVILDRTAIYGESGGQKGDKGVIEAEGMKMRVSDAKKLGDGKILHFVYVEEGAASVGDEVVSSYDKEKRLSTARNHSATHLLQKALQEVLGSHIEQAGSFVDENRLRFDFTHYEAISPEDLAEVERRVNEAILKAMAIDVKVMPIDEAKKLGAMALFGEKYGENVRVVNMGGYSIEFCGGTHLKNTAEAGLFKILSEGGVAAGVRRIEATTGKGVLEYIKNNDAVIRVASKVLKTSPTELCARAESIEAELKSTQHEIEKLREKIAAETAKGMLRAVKRVGEVDILTAQVSDMSVNEVKSLTDKFKENVECGVAVVASVADGKISFVAAATKAAVAKGVHCGNIIREVTKMTDGKGGGKPDMAQGGGKLINKIDNALAIVDEIVEKQTGGAK
ncbi:MAG: alanine--tRNA ligase [Clostridia bacterium]|nr:alanine--tRNA ligase [Clostridia bacterium]